MPGDIASRLAKAETFWATARSLQQRDPDSAVSRAYYVVYHACAALLLARSLPQETDERIRARDHREILVLANRAFGEAMERRRVRREYGSTFIESLWAINTARSHADYGLGYSDAVSARVEVQFARRVLTATKEILTHGD